MTCYPISFLRDVANYLKNQNYNNPYQEIVAIQNDLYNFMSAQTDTTLDVNFIPIPTSVLRVCARLATTNDKTHNYTLSIKYSKTEVNILWLKRHGFYIIGDDGLARHEEEYTSCMAYLGDRVYCIDTNPIQNLLDSLSHNFMSYWKYAEICTCLDRIRKGIIRIDNDHKQKVYTAIRYLEDFFYNE